MAYVVIWPGGHQMALTRERALLLMDAAQRAMPGQAVRVEDAEAYSAQAVGAVPPVVERRTRRAAGERVARPRRRRGSR